MAAERWQLEQEIEAAVVRHLLVLQWVGGRE